MGTAKESCRACTVRELYHSLRSRRRLSLDLEPHLAQDVLDVGGASRQTLRTVDRHGYNIHGLQINRDFKRGSARGGGCA
jgi:hypothetical protein